MWTTTFTKRIIKQLITIKLIALTIQNQSIQEAEALGNAFS